MLISIEHSYTLLLGHALEYAAHTRRLRLGSNHGTEAQVTGLMYLCCTNKNDFKQRLRPMSGGERIRSHFCSALLLWMSRQTALSIVTTLNIKLQEQCVRYSSVWLNLPCLLQQACSSHLSDQSHYRIANPN